MSTTDDIAVVRKLYEAFEGNDLATLTGLLHPDVQVHQAGSLPWSGTYDGPEGVARFLGALTEHIDTTVEIHELFDAGDAVVQVGRSRGTTRAGGRPFDIAEVHVLHVHDGLVAHFEALVDTDAFLAALT